MIVGSLRKGSYNAIVQQALPSLAPEGMTIRAAPSFAEFPLYTADVQNSTGFPAPSSTARLKSRVPSPAVTVLRSRIRQAAGIIAGMFQDFQCQIQNLRIIVDS